MEKQNNKLNRNLESIESNSNKDAASNGVKISNENTIFYLTENQLAKILSQRAILLSNNRQINVVKK